MSTSTRKDGSATDAEPGAASEAPGPAGAPPAPGYEPPRIVRVGSLRDLVGKSGPLADLPGPDPRRASG